MKTNLKTIVEFFNSNPQAKNKIKVKTRYGYYKIEDAAITAKNSIVHNIKLSNGTIFRCSPKHRLWKDNSWEYAENLLVGDNILSENGYLKIVSNDIEKEREDLYDLQVNKVCEYYANGLVSHNSTIQDAITFALFGKSFRKANKSALINDINGKDCLVTLHLNYNGRKYKIIRGMKPTIFEIYIENKLKPNLSSYKEDQEWLEKHLQISYSSFVHIVILGNANYTPFMEKTSSERRHFIEETLGLTEISDMKLITKDRLKVITQEIKDLNKDISSLESQKLILEKSIISLESILKKQNETTNKEIEELTLKISGLSQRDEELKEQKETLKSKIESFGNVDHIISSLKEKKILVQSKKDLLQKDLNIYKKYAKCPTCKQDISIDHKKEKLEEIKKELETIINNVKNIEKEIKENEKTKTTLNKIEEEYKEVCNSIKEVTFEMKYNVEHLKSVKMPSNSTNELESLKNDLDNLKLQILAIKETLDEREYDKNTLEKIFDSYEPVKQKTIKTYIPLINNFLNKYLTTLGLNVGFSFNENFEEVINSKYKTDYCYSSFSEGEKMRINLALLLTWREICKLKNSFNCNLLILDEVCDSSLDFDGMNSFLSLIKSLDSNIFIISHREDVINDDFDCVIKVKKSRSTYLLKSNN